LFPSFFPFSRRSAPLFLSPLCLRAGDLPLTAPLASDRSRRGTFRPPNDVFASSPSAFPTIFFDFFSRDRDTNWVSLLPRPSPRRGDSLLKASQNKHCRRGPLFFTLHFTLCHGVGRRPFSGSHHLRIPLFPSYQTHFFLLRYRSFLLFFFLCKSGDGHLPVDKGTLGAADGQTLLPGPSSSPGTPSVR